METHVCAIITDEENNLRYLFIDVSKSDVEEIILSFVEDDLDSYIQDYQYYERNGFPEYGADFWIGKSRAEALIDVSYTYSIEYFDGIKFKGE